MWCNPSLCSLCITGTGVVELVVVVVVVVSCVAWIFFHRRFLKSGGSAAEVGFSPGWVRLTSNKSSKAVWLSDFVYFDHKSEEDEDTVRCVRAESGVGNVLCGRSCLMRRVRHTNSRSEQAGQQARACLPPRGAWVTKLRHLPGWLAWVWLGLGAPRDNLDAREFVLVRPPCLGKINQDDHTQVNHKLLWI